MNTDYYINVAELMKDQELPRPKLKPTILVNNDEWLPLITVESEV